MPYTLQEFKNWLEAEPSRKRNLPHWKEAIGRMEKNNEWEFFVEYPGYREKDDKFGRKYFLFSPDFSQEYLIPNKDIILYNNVWIEWYLENEEEMIKENKTKRKNKNMLNAFKNWLNEDKKRKKGLDKWDAYLSFLETKNADLENLFVYSDFVNTISQEEQAEYVKIIENWIELENEEKPNPKDLQIEQLEIELRAEKDKVAELETEYQELMKQLENIKTELALTPSTPQPEKQTLKDRISYFNNFIKKNRQESLDLRENIKKEKQKSQEIRSSLISLENQLKDQENKSQEINQLTQENEALKKQLSDLTNNLSQQKASVNKLEQENNDLQTKITADQLLNEEKNKQIPYGTYFLWGIIAVVLLVGGFFGYKWIRKNS